MSTILYFLAIVCSILSNFPIILDAGLDAPLKFMWGLPFFYIFIVHNTRLLWDKRLLPFYFFVTCFYLYCIGCESILGKNYLGIDFKNILISSLIAITSYAYWKEYGSGEKLEMLSFLLLGCGILLGLYVYFEYLANSSILERAYAVKSKNSIGQIIFCCALIPLLAIKRDSNRFKNLIYIAIIVLTFIVFMIKSRATIVGIFFVIIYFTFNYGSFKVKIYFFATLLIAILFTLFNETLYNIFVNGILFSGRNVENLNDLSSGRIVLITECLDGISKNFWLGNGNRYMDCMPIIMLYQYGFWGALMIFSFLAYISYHIIFLADRRIPTNLITFLLLGCFMLNSLFEAQPPFGPGVKCFLLWVFVGFSLAKPYQE